MKKRILSMVTTLCLLLTLFPVTAFADGVYYNKENVHGIEGNKTYCGDTYFTVDIPAEYIREVSYYHEASGTYPVLTPDEDGRYKLDAGLGRIHVCVMWDAGSSSHGSIDFMEIIIYADHVDSDKDHKCDNGCDEVIGTCEDTDRDHTCDYGCGKTFGTCEDTDRDHKCDICGETVSQCTGGTATCTEKAKCEVCGEPYGEVNDANHTDEKEWTTKNETQHEQKWKCCGATVVTLENHEWKDGVCEECGYVCLHTGGTADCTHKAKCEVCGEEYGEVDADNHTTLKHIEAKAATYDSEGNTEYWHCEDCNKYFSDENGKNEIKLLDTVIAKLVKNDDDNKSPQTGDNSHMALWLALALLSGGALVGTGLYGKKKNRFVK